jgi:hypothetical protein
MVAKKSKTPWRQLMTIDINEPPELPTHGMFRSCSCPAAIRKKSGFTRMITVDREAIDALTAAMRGGSIEPRVA